MNSRVGMPMNETEQNRRGYAREKLNEAAALLEQRKYLEAAKACIEANELMILMEIDLTPDDG